MRRFTSLRGQLTVTATLSARWVANSSTAQFVSIGNKNPHLCACSDERAASLVVNAVTAARTHIFDPFNESERNGQIDDRRGGCGTLHRFMKPQDDKRQFQCTLNQLGIALDNNGGTTKSNNTQSVLSALPELQVVQDIGEVMAAAAFGYLQFVLASLAQHDTMRAVDEANKAALLTNLEKRSVFRIWEYDAGNCGSSASSRNSQDEPLLGVHSPAGVSSLCRAHYDPGLVTILFQGSHKGLEVNEVDTLACTGMDEAATATTTLKKADGTERDINDTVVLGNWNSTAAVEAANAMGNWVPIEELLLQAHRGNNHDTATKHHHQQLICFPDTLLDLVSGQRAKQLLHRVNYVGGAEDASRINFVVELRPASKKKWYSSRL